MSTARCGLFPGTRASGDTRVGEPPAGVRGRPRQAHADARPRRLATALLAAGWAVFVASGATAGDAVAADAVASASGASGSVMPYTVTDDRGVEVRFDAVPARVVTLLPSLTETVCALGACGRLVGTDRFSDWPGRVTALPKLGGIEDVSVERLYALHPDVVLAAGSTRVLERLESLGLKVVALEPRSLADARRTVAAVARVLALPDEAEALLARIDVRVREAVGRVPSDWRGARVYFEVSSAPYAAGESSFIGELLARLGLGNVVPASFGPFPKLNPEFVVRAGPDVIMGSRDGLDSMPERPGWGALSALRGGRACGFEERRHDVLVRPGPRLGEAAAILADCLASLPPRGAVPR